MYLFRSARYKWKLQLELEQSGQLFPPSCRNSITEGGREGGRERAGAKQRAEIAVLVSGVIKLRNAAKKGRQESENKSVRKTGSPHAVSTSCSDLGRQQPCPFTRHHDRQGISEPGNRKKYEQSAPSQGGKPDKYQVYESNEVVPCPAYRIVSNVLKRRTAVQGRTV